MNIPNMPSDYNQNAMGMPPMDDGDNMGDNMNLGDESMQMDDTDPKKYIQQLTGKLSQELRKYNNEQENPDEDLNKYVAGMIIPQASKGLTDKGKREIIKKVEKGVISDENVDMDDESVNNEPIEGDVQTECVNEIVNNVIDDSANRKNPTKITNKTLPKHNPFRSSR